MNLIEQVKPGDILLLHCGFNQCQPVEVTRVLKRYFEAGRLRWDRDGHPYPRGSEWSRFRVTIPVPDEIKAVSFENKRKALAQRLSKTEWEKLPLETLQKIRELLDHHVKTGDA